MPARKIAHVGTWCSGCRRCFLQWIDRAKETPTVRLSAENNVARKVGRKSSRGNFSSSGDDLKAAEDSEDEGGVTGVRYDH